MSRRISCGVLVLAAVTGCRPAAPPRAPAGANNPVAVSRVIIDAPRPVPPVAGPEPDLPALRTQRTTIGLVLHARYRCDIEDALELREYEGSILGSWGIDVAVTYFVPILHPERCQPSRDTHEYRVAVDWERRTDTPWTIAVAGYQGAIDRVPGTALYARRLAGHSISAADRAELDAMHRIGEHPGASMSNAGGIQKVQATRDRATGELVLSVTVRYGNQCEAETPWRLEPVVWAPDRDGTAHLWATLEPPRRHKTCPGFAQMSPPPLATSQLRIAPPKGARSIAILVPNVPRGGGLPVHTAQVALQR